MGDCCQTRCAVAARRIELFGIVCAKGVIVAAFLIGLFSRPTSIFAQSTSTKPPALEQIESEPLREDLGNFFSSYCFDCHDGDGAEGNIDLVGLVDAELTTSDLKVWAKVLRVVEEQSMPPAEMDQPTIKQRNAMGHWLLQEVAKRPRQPAGRLRRLTKIEYENTIRELFRLERNCFNNSSRILKTTDYFQPATYQLPRYVFGVSYFFNSQFRFSDLPDVGALPVDPPTEHGFANQQSALSVSPLMLENYLAVASGLLDSDEFREISGLWRSMFLAPNGLTNEQLLARGSLKLANFLPRAFRRQPVADEVNRYERLFGREFQETNNYTTAMKTTVSAILVSPHFLFRQEFATRAASDDVVDRERQINDAIANRLAFFLWASMPDDLLLQAAREGRLTDRDELIRQTRRMLNDRRSKALATQFGMQWLKVNKVASVQPDKDVFPKYYRMNAAKEPPVAVAMMIEQLLLFESIMVEDRTILDFLNADYAYLNRQLIDWYRLKPQEVLDVVPEQGSFRDFYRIKWPVGHRGGVITAGATMMSTSTTKRTSPVYRGAWVLDVIFNSPPPPAPANVPSLEEQKDGEIASATNIRDRFRLHREDTACASCHDRIDPLGFALENFDAVGQWRSKYPDGTDIDTSAEFANQKFAGAARLKNIIRRQEARFVRAFVGHLMKYALGRSLDLTDEPAIRTIAENVKRNEYRFRAVVEAIVTSDAFLQVDFDNRQRLAKQVEPERKRKQ